MDVTAADASAYAAETYTDFSGLAALKRNAATHDPAAVRQVAQQFEAMFTRMMLKSMRDAVGTDPIFGSDQEQMYQGMYDDQLALQLSRGRGLGLADMLIHQLQRMGVPGAAAAAAAKGGVAGAPGNSVAGTGAARAAGPGQRASAGLKMAPASQALKMGPAPGSPKMAPASKALKMGFIQGLWPQARQAGSQLGVDPRNLIAQAALETNWGRSVPGDGAGHSSNNLFGVKAAAGWDAGRVQAATTEYQNGAPQAAVGQFRAYGDDSQSFQDYVALLRGNPRYAAALNTGSDAQAFATGLARGGYATDPDYARKLDAVANNIAGTLAMSLRGLRGLKSGGNLPTTAGTDVL